MGYTEPYHITFTEEPSSVRIQVGLSPDSEVDLEFARFDSAAAPTARSRSRETWTAVDRRLAAGIAGTVGLGPRLARQIAIEAAVHEALGNDYLVSPNLARSRHAAASEWARQVGACSVPEAFRLAATKARMYRSVPMLVAPTALGTVNVGRWYDLAVTHFVPNLMKAITGALAPSASPGKAATGDHLLAIRARLGEILVGRDAVYRLTRRAALGPMWGRSFDLAPAGGSVGNDLTANLAYHLSACLNSVYAATDNVAWVLAKLDDPKLRSRRVGFSSLLDTRSAPWKEGPSAAKGVDALLNAPGLQFVLAAREVRNQFMHREGIDYGGVDWHPVGDAPLMGLAALWIFSDALPAYPLRKGAAEPFKALASSANFLNSELALFTFQTFTDRLWDAASDTVDACLAAISWGSGRWIRGVPDGPGDDARRRWWRGRLQKRLWGLT